MNPKATGGTQTSSTTSVMLYVLVSNEVCRLTNVSYLNMTPSIKTVYDTDIEKTDNDFEKSSNFYVIT